VIIKSIVKAVIFDMDGVLVETMKYHMLSWEKALHTFNIFPTDEELYLIEGMSYKETIDVLSKKYSVELTQHEKEQIYSTKKKTLLEICKFIIYPYVIEILQFLKQKNVKMALVSGSNKEFVSTVIEKNFNNFFNVIITGSDVKNGKPSPEPYLVSLKKLQLKPNEVLVVENAPLGIESAKTAQLKTFALTTTLDKKHLLKADKIFSNHLELLKYIKTLVI